MPATTITKYPRELSPGQLQKISLARALLLRPKVLIIDEPTSTLDATFRVIYMDLIKKISSSLNISILVVDNDIKFSKQYADRIAVMESGHIVEIATVDEILNRPLHDYTKKLVESLPIMKMHYKREDMIPYEKDSYIDYLLDIPITFEVFPGHFASMRDREMNAILKEYKGAKDLLSEVLK
ncbi:hypothetical protein Zmor_011852 [Zophobas morio]|uniref:ABC transporter domain-containing protein n=1 Tax=Zophobas morio TaxID=2755281 RepID=A0AA38M1K5_9CUCU|nr:hypothetical protein Zmor_011852 [Zophobas morio]